MADSKKSDNKNRNVMISQAISRAIVYAIGRLTGLPDRDVLFQDFHQIEEVYFTKFGTTFTPASEIEFKLGDYAQNGFKYFRQKFGISSDLFMISFSGGLNQVSNPGASGSMFFVTKDDQFIVKTLDKREAEFLIGVLPGYYMNLQQNQDTTLPKFYGLYKFGFFIKNFRLVVMNNLLPSSLKFHEKYDLKGSTFKRKASEKELSKRLPTLKDLDFIDKHPNGFFLKEEERNSLMNILKKDVRVLESFKIMDYSLLLVVHNKTIYDQTSQAGTDMFHGQEYDTVLKNAKSKKADHRLEPNLAVEKNINAKRLKSGTLLNTVPTSDKAVPLDNTRYATTISCRETTADDNYKAHLKKGIQARDENGNEVYLFLGIIDILQNYRLSKKTEHTFKSLFQPGEKISVSNPRFYATRFLEFCGFIFQCENNVKSYDECMNKKKKGKPRKMDHSESRPAIGNKTNELKFTMSTPHVQNTSKEFKKHSIIESVSDEEVEETKETLKDDS